MLTHHQQTAVDSLKTLNSLAADFKMGIVPNTRVRLMLLDILTAMGLDAVTTDAVMQDLMRHWGEWDDEDYLDSNAHLDQVE
jgi:hypothetical protein